MKKINTKGFTIVELVIVIAVIAILAAVLIPTFGGIVEKAQDSALQQESAALYKEAYAFDLSDGSLDGMDNGAVIANIEGSIVKYAVDAGKAKFAYAKDKKIAKFDGAEWTITAHVDHIAATGEGVNTNICKDCGACMQHDWEAAEVGKPCKNPGCTETYTAPVEP